MVKKGVHDRLPSGLLSSKHKRVKIFREIPVNNQGFTLLNIPHAIQKDILHKLKDREIVALLRYRDPDEVTDLLQCIKSSRHKKILHKLEKELKEKVEYLLKFNRNTAAGMMSVDYVEVDVYDTFADVSKVIKKHERRTGRFPTVLVVEKGFLLGELLGHKIVLRPNREKIKRHIQRIPHVIFDDDEDTVISTFQKHPHNKIVVLADDKSIMGMIYSDDVLKIMHQNPAESLSDFAGISDEEDVLDSWYTKVKYRYKWLILNLFTAFMAAGVISLFEETISKWVLLAIYMPIVAGMGGNAGTQAMAVAVRGIALKEVDLHSGRRTIINEMMAGAVNGLIVGVLVAIIATMFNSDWMLGLVLGVSLVVNLIIAGLFGSTIPLVLKRLGKDPASSASIFITTATDVFGFFIFLGLASIVL